MRWLKRIGLVLLAVVVLVVGSGLLLLWRSGAWGAFFPSHTHESVAPELPADLGRPAILVFTKTNGFRHVEAIAASVPLFEEIAAARGLSFFHTENGAAFTPEVLGRFDAVVFANASGDTLSDEQDATFARWLEAGGGWLGIHAAGDGSHADWRWYVETLIGADYDAHILGPQFQTARVVVEDRTHPATRAIPQEWYHEEEWYSWQSSPREGGMHVLATVDESSYEPWVRFRGMEKDLRMGDHPILWTTCVGRGRAIYSALGHQGAAYAKPEYRAVLEGAVAWITGQDGEGCDGSEAAGS